MRTRFVLLPVLVLLSLLLTGCFVPTGGGQLNIQTAFSLEFNSESYAYDATLDFGPVDPDGDPLAVVGEVHNLLESEVTVTAVSVDNTRFSLELPSLPVTVAAGESIAVSLSFDPIGSGDEDAALSVTVADVELPFLLNLTGEGNFPPVAYEAVVVTGAGTPSANGTYYRNGTLNETLDDPPVQLPYYENPVTGYRIFGEVVEGIWWTLDASPDLSNVLYDMQYVGPVAPSTAPGPNTFWGLVNGSAAAPTSVGPFTLDYPEGGLVGDTVTASYVFGDLEGDAEAGSTIQWYRSPVNDRDGIYTPIAGATSLSYTTVSADTNTFLQFEVTPRSATGTQLGAPVMIGPTARFVTI